MALVLNNISGSKDQNSTIGITGSVKIGRPLGAQDLPAMPGTDVTFFVSGAIGKQGTADTHASTAVVGGDAVVSGSLYVDNGIFASEYIKHSEDSNTSIRFQVDNIQMHAGGDVGITISENYLQNHIALNNLANDVDIHIYAEDGEYTGNFQQTPGGKTLFHGVAASGAEQVLILSGGGGTSLNEAGGNDVAFYVSGSVGKRGTSERGTAVFGGDVYVSGALYSDDITITDDLEIGDDLNVSGVVSGSSVETGLLFSDSGDLVIHNQASDKDIILRLTMVDLRPLF